MTVTSSTGSTNDGATETRSDRQVDVRTPAGETSGSVTLPAVSPAGVRTSTWRSARVASVVVDWVTGRHSPRGRP